MSDLDFVFLPLRTGTITIAIVAHPTHDMTSPCTPDTRFSNVSSKIQLWMHHGSICCFLKAALAATIHSRGTGDMTRNVDQGTLGLWGKLDWTMECGYFQLRLSPGCVGHWI